MRRVGGVVSLLDLLQGGGVWGAIPGSSAVKCDINSLSDFVKINERIRDFI